MSADHDRKFFDIFLMVLGGLVALTIGIYFVAQMTGGRAQAQYIQDDPAYIQMQEERISPAGRVAIAGEDNSDLPSSSAAGATAALVQTSPSAPAEMSGQQVYDSACAACHAAGVAGAPKLGDSAAWSPRVSQGIDTMAKHAIEGFQGNSGFMPAKGGRADLSDASIKAAVSYMIDNSG